MATPSAAVPTSDQRPPNQPPRGIAFDGVTALTIYLVLLVAIPSKFVIAPLGSVGGAASVLALAAGFWWSWYHLHRTEPEGAGSQPVRVAGLVFMCAGIASYAAAMLRATPAAEMSSANSGILRLAAWIGILLVANDGIRDGQRLEVFLRRLVLAGGLLGTLGLVQFISGQTLVDHLSIPGFSSNQLFTDVQSRGGFTRSNGTAIHPLEYAAVLTMIFPLALTHGLVTPGSLLRRWWPALAISAACAVSLSRSTMLCLLVGLIVMAATWTPAIRRLMLGATAALGAAIFMVVPGMIGVVLNLFGGISQDSSALSRWESINLVGAFFERAPLFGRGLSTFLPEYRILDNQYFATLIEMGAVGLLALLGVSVAAFACSEAARRSTTILQPWAQALSASIAAGTVSFAFFDGFAFPQAVGLYFLIAGTCGAVWRIARAQNTPTEPLGTAALSR